MAKASHANQTKGCLVTWLQDPTEVSSIAKTGREVWCRSALLLPCSFWPSLHSPPSQDSFPESTIYHGSQMLPSEHDGYIHPPTPHHWVRVALHTRTSLSAAATILAIIISCLVHYTVLTSQPPPHLFNQNNHFMEAGHACSLLRILQWLPITLRTQDNILRIK